VYNDALLVRQSVGATFDCIPRVLPVFVCDEIVQSTQHPNYPEDFSWHNGDDGFSQGIWYGSWLGPSGCNNERGQTTPTLPVAKSCQTSHLDQTGHVSDRTRNSFLKTHWKGRGIGLETLRMMGHFVERGIYVGSVLFRPDLVSLLERV
jgi:hypothetical protein